MNCKQCEHPLPDETRFCPNCGADQTANIENQAWSNSVPTSTTYQNQYGTNIGKGMEKREKTLFLIAGILFVFSCLNFLRTLTALADFLNILAFLSTGFIAVILFMKRKDWFLGIALGVNALICLISFVRLLPFQGFSLVGFLKFLFPALLCAVIFFEKQIAPFKKPLMLVCAYLSAVSLLLIIKDYA